MTAGDRVSARVAAIHEILSQETPFDRGADARPLMSILVDADRVTAADQNATARVLALAELPFLDVRNAALSDGHPGNRADLHVVSSLPSEVTASSGAVTPSRALDLVRILLVNLGLFYLRGGTTVNEGFYYLYRFKSVFRAYQPAWSAATFGGASIGDAVRDQLASLGTRLEFLCRAADRGAYFALRRANNDTEDNTLYHLAYFVMLATGVFDDLAWTLAAVHDVPLRREHMVLKVPANRKSTPLLDALRGVAPTAVARIEDAALQQIFHVFYPLRDRLQHRQFLRGLLHVGGPWAVPRILFEFPPDAVEAIQRASADGACSEWGLGLVGGPYVDPYAFLSRGLHAIATVHDAVLEAIAWPDLVGPPGHPVRDQIDESAAQYERSLARFLRWPSEPLYF